MVWAEVRGGEPFGEGGGGFGELSAEPHEEERESGVQRTESSAYFLRNRIEYYTDLMTGRRRIGPRESQCFLGGKLRETLIEIK